MSGLLSSARVYLSGPMDFVASRAAERATGWRNRIGQFLRHYGVTVFDPWEKPAVRGLQEYGAEGEATTSARNLWTYDQSRKGSKRRMQVAESFWPALHIDLRMVDTSDFLIAYCPTNIYSVGTPHEIILARQQLKPVLFVSPYVEFDTLHELRKHLKKDKKGTELLEKLATQVPIKENLNASPSLWYMPLIGGERFFDGFGFEPFCKQFGWAHTAIDEHEKKHKPKNPLLPYLAQLNKKLPKKWDAAKRKMVPDDDWLLWDLHPKNEGANVAGPRNGKKN
jgi:hypothetical protein